MYILGGPVTLGVKVRDSAGALTNAGTIALAIQQPDGTLVSPAPTVTNPPAVTGEYSHTFTPVQAGRHTARWTTASPATTPFVDAFDVADTYPPLIVSLADAKAYLNIDSDDTDQDDELRDFIEALTAPIEKICGAVARRSRTVYLRPCGLYDRIALPYSPVVSLTSATLVRDSSAVTITNWYADGGVLYTSDGSSLPLEPFTLTYVVGRPDLPANIRMGALSVLKLAWRSQRGNNPDSFMPFLVANAAAEWFAGDEQLLGFA